MQTYAFILGSTPELSIEELLHVLPSLGYISEINKRFILFQGDIDCSAVLSRLGGTVKIGRVVHECEKYEDFSIDVWLHALRSELASSEGKFVFGSSVYADDDRLVRFIRTLGVTLKKHVKKLSRPARYVANTEGLLSSVAVQKNHLLGRELLVLYSGAKYYFAFTSVVQDFEEYGERDFGRPMRNMRRGMLPPKLAQIFLNLADTKLSDNVLDPFCGGGTVIQEALLAGIGSVWGSDKDASAIREATSNMAWLKERYRLPESHLAVCNIDSVSQKYEANFFDVIVTEPFLGPAVLLRSSALTRFQFQSVIESSVKLYADFFRSVRGIMKQGGRMTVVFPLFTLFGRESTVGDLASYERFGWKLMAPEVGHALARPHLSPRGQLLYGRRKQIIQREITMWRAS